MRRALWLSALLLGMLAISSHVDARGGGGGSFSRGFRGFSGVHRPVFAARHVHALGSQRRQSFGQTTYPIGGDYWWPDWWPGDSQIAEYLPAPEPPSEPQVIIIHANNSGAPMADAAPDYGYIPGCHAIPNGYHCDVGGAH